MDHPSPDPIEPLPPTRGRSLTVDDLFRIQHVRNPVFSPDGRWLAFEVTRPPTDGPVRRLTYWDQIHCDIWLAPVAGGEPRNLTEGGRTGEGFWHPLWSPGGQRLAMLWFHGSGVRVRIWDAAAETLAPLEDLAIKHQYWLDGLAWLSDRKLAAITWPPTQGVPGREPCRLRVATRLGEGPARRWPLAWSGAACTATVLVSGEGPWPAAREAAHAQLWIVDIEDGSRQLVDEGNLHSLTVSPDGGFLAYFKSTPDVPRMQPDQPSPGMFEWAEYHLHVATPEGPPVRVAAVQHPDMSTLAWAPGGRQLAVLQQPAAEGREALPPVVLRVSMPGGESVSGFPGASPGRSDDCRSEEASPHVEGPAGTHAVGGRTGVLTPAMMRGPVPGSSEFGSSIAGGCEVVSRGDLVIDRFAWTADDRLLISARPAPEAEGSVPNRTDWWLASDNGAWRNLTAGMEVVPERLVSAGASLIGAAGGRLWRIDPAGQPPEPLPTEPAGEITAIPWVGPAAPPPSREAILIVQLRQPEGDALFLGRCSGEAVLKLQPLPKPPSLTPDVWLGGDAGLKAAEARGPLVFPDPQTAVSPDGWAVAFTAEDRTGHFLWLAKAGALEPPASLAALNTWTAQIAEPRIRELTYRSLNGQELKAKLLLPDDYEEGRRCPLITSAYPGSIQRWRLITPFTLPFPHAPQLLTAHGYAVLYASMPMPDGACDPYMEMLNGVIPAVDRAIELGIADPDRLGLFGHSGGGWVVYSLVTQTTRFHAAVASAGLTDLASAYGTFDAGYRYGEIDEPYTDIAYWSKFWERGFGRMGGPPWKEAARYARNSPISYVDRVRTPLLMIHGDFDGVPATQSEQFFTALFRQGKPAGLLRYEGEEHCIEAEPNVRDLWARIYEWFDFHLRPR